MQPVGESDREGAAASLIRLAQLRLTARPDLRVIAANVGIKLSAAAPKGCGGAFTKHPPTARADGRGPPVVALERLTHEFGHVACWLFDLEHACEDTVTDVGQRIILPTKVMTEAVHYIGLDAWQLMRAFHDVLPSTVFIRAAVASGGAAIILRGGRREVHKPKRFNVPPEFSAIERVLFEAVRSAGRPCWHTGIGAWPFSDGPHDRGGVVILVPAEVDIRESCVVSARR